MLTALDAPAIRRWSAAAVEALETHRQEIDDLNVYPVPDGDTGTNLALTVRAGHDALAATELVDPADCLAELARGAVLGAHGNSGVILSQILRGLAESCPPDAPLEGAGLAGGLARAAELAYAAVADPVEGTILSVVRAAAEAAAAADVAANGGRPAGLVAVATAAARAAAKALAQTPAQLPALARAGVVDAGGRGLVIVLDALLSVVTGDPLVVAAASRVVRDRRALEAARETGSAEFGYEVQYLLQAPDEAAHRLRAELAGLGDSVVVVGTGDGHWNVHAHVNDVGAAMEAGIQAGRPYRITVTRFADQIAAGTALVAMAPGEGISDLFVAEGALVVTGGLAEGSLSTGQVLTAIEGTGAGRVVLLPNSANLTAVASAAAEQARQLGIHAAVVPTRSPVQGLAAVAVHDPARPFQDDMIAMTEAAVATRYAEVTIATRDAITMAGRCSAGDVLGLVDGDVVLIGAEVAAVSQQLVDRLLAGGGELVTLIVGVDAPAELAELVERQIRVRYPAIEVVTYQGGQPVYPLLVGVE